MYKILYLFLLLPFTNFAQSASDRKLLPSRDGKIFYEMVDSPLSKKKSEIFASAKTWFAEKFNDSKTILQIDDQEGGELLGKATFSTRISDGSASPLNSVQFTIKVSCRDRKYRIQIYDLGSRHSSEYDFEPMDWMNKPGSTAGQVFLANVDKEILSIMLAAKDHIEKQSDNF